jgi:hypothetical protein
MNIRKMIICCTALLLGANVAWALDGDEAESTIRLMGAADADLPKAVTKEITLPEAASEDSAAVANTEREMKTANENREQRKEGLEQADEVRQRSSDMAGEAHDNRENRERSRERPEPGPPADPGRPPDSQ